MKETEVIRQESGALISGEAARALTQMAQAMQGLADMMRATNERMTALEQQVRLLTKVTPMQAGEIGKEIRMRAAVLCESYRAAGCENAVAAAIRRDVRLMQGVQNVREVPRCEYAVVIQQIKLWDDYKGMKAIIAKAKKGAEKNGK